ncbi:ABC transporter permease [Gemmata sp. G18]|uniref:ABC transporter permease n=1 Tax=Gemmata palustris TaxID=2822762 RepID=A0ABS5BYM8_9BACT|nr:ABC transporter permease [Gemmata palustris]MBP3958846.1 ABC transporter permease [Gemmata palustris]
MPGTATKVELLAPPKDGPNPVYALAQTVAGLLVPLVLLRPFRFLLVPRRSGGSELLRAVLLFGFAGFWLLVLTGQAATFAFKGFPPFKEPPKFDPLTFGAVIGALFRAVLGGAQVLLAPTILFDWLFFRSFSNLRTAPPAFERAVKLRFQFERGIYSLIGTLFVVGFSLLPLAALLAALPLVAPSEAVLSDTVRPARSWWRRTARRAFAAGAGVAVLIALFAFAVEVVTQLPLPAGGQLGVLAKKVLGTSTIDLLPERAMAGVQPDDSWLSAQELLDKKAALERARDRAARSQTTALWTPEDEAEVAAAQRDIDERALTSVHMQVRLDPKLAPWLARPIWAVLPPALIQHWPFVFLFVYATDLFLLLLIGRVPLAYNFRYLWVRKRDTALTALAFTVVVALVVVLLAFVNGMYKLNESTGVPGNVMVLAEGSTDELFSNLERAAADNVERVEVTAANGAKYAIARAVRGPDGALDRLPVGAPLEVKGAAYLASLESYMVMNQAVPSKPGETARRRFLQVRALRDPQIAAAVHNMELEPGGKWFAGNGVHQESGGKYLPCVLGGGAAGTLGADIGKPRLGPGDTFELADQQWVVTGVMKSEGTTFGSEVWVSDNNLAVHAAGKKNRYTTLVLRTADDNATAARAVSDYLNRGYTQASLKAFAETDYYNELTKTNETFLTWIVFLAGVMAVGGIFGVMNTMFASIAARIKEVGVLRILGFKRWQILISFMIESLAIAFVGGAVGCALGYFANGFEAASTLSGGQGGGKSVTLKMVVDYQILAAGMLFTLVMGRLGGLVPALSAMRMEILDSLR